MEQLLENVSSAEKFDYFDTYVSAHRDIRKQVLCTGRNQSYSHQPTFYTVFLGGRGRVLVCVSLFVEISDQAFTHSDQFYRLCVSLRAPTPSGGSSTAQQRCDAPLQHARERKFSFFLSFLHEMVYEKEKREIKACSPLCISVLRWFAIHISVGFVSTPWSPITVQVCERTRT